MIDPERPPLDPLIFEEIKAECHALDLHHWPLLIAFQIPNFHPLNVPVPPSLPLNFREAVLAYAVSLFESEANHYERFRADNRYAPWLNRLEGRVLAKVTDALDKIEQGNPKSSLWYHGMSQQEIVAAVRVRLWEMSSSYWSKDYGPKAAIVVKAQEIPVPPNPTATSSSKVPADQIERMQIERASLRDAYRNAFPDTGIMDICWAAKQTYREWARWLKGEAADGSRPDRSFRHVLSSGKSARELRREIRPKGWK